MILWFLAARLGAIGVCVVLGLTGLIRLGLPITFSWFGVAIVTLIVHLLLPPWKPFA